MTPEPQKYQSTDGSPINALHVNSLAADTSFRITSVVLDAVPSLRRILDINQLPVVKKFHASPSEVVKAEDVVAGGGPDTEFRD